ncbi:hypothetical protein TNCV_2504201 [Trichonephila clavipes]|nr:hypothetical protein TNCV_2504201 [Trichonephila clavipes]
MPGLRGQVRHKDGLANHRRSHKREEVGDELPALNIPGTQAEESEKKEQLAPLTTGEPGNMRLAPPPQTTYKPRKASPG